jgi:hypothetical protein
MVLNKGEGSDYCPQTILSQESLLKALRCPQVREND